MSNPVDPRLESQRISLGDVTLHAMVGGPPDGKLVVLLHGFPEYWACWRGQIPGLLDAGYRVVAPDMRGYNTSDKPSGIQHYSKDKLAGDVVALIHHLGAERAHVVSHDWGGVVGWWLALKHPDVCERVVMLNIPHPVVFTKTLKSSFKQIRASWYVFFFQLPWLPEWVLQRRDFAALTKVFDSARPGAFTDQEMNDYKAAWSQPGAVKAMLAYYRAAVRVGEQRPDSYQVQPPLLLIWGKNDIALTTQMAEASVEFCKDGRLELLDASHWVQNDQPERVTELVLEHLAGA